MEPYPEVEKKPEIADIDYIYRIKFKYSLNTAKPKPVYTAKWNFAYDAILTYSKYETDTLSPYSETYHIFPVKYKDYDRSGSGKSRKNGKKTLLYMPTFGDDENVDIDGISNALASLENDYNIALKIHQGIQYRSENKEFSDFLESLNYKKYYQNDPLDEVMSAVDVILTGNSGSIYEAMYIGKPVAIFTKNIEKYSYIVEPYHLTLIKQGVLQSTDSESEIPDTVNRAVKNFKLQDARAKEEFLFDESGDTFSGVIKHFIERSGSVDDKHKIKRALVERHFGKRDNHVEIIKMYENSISWKITKPLRVIKYNMVKILRSIK